MFEHGIVFFPLWDLQFVGKRRHNGILQTLRCARINNMRRRRFCPQYLSLQLIFRPLLAAGCVKPFGWSDGWLVCRCFAWCNKRPGLHSPTVIEVYIRRIYVCTYMYTRSSDRTEVGQKCERDPLCVELLNLYICLGSNSERNEGADLRFM
jgi:hypothetical protein